MKSHIQHPSHLFTLRLWKEAQGGGVEEVRFQVQHVLSGESRIFQDDEAMVAYLRAKVKEAEQEAAEREES